MPNKSNFHKKAKRNSQSTLYQNALPKIKEKTRWISVDVNECSVNPAESIKLKKIKYFAINAKEKNLLVEFRDNQDRICEYIFQKNQIFKLKEIKFAASNYLEWHELFQVSQETLKALEAKNKQKNFLCFPFYRSKSKIHSVEVIVYKNIVKTYCELLKYYPSPLIEDMQFIQNKLFTILSSIPKDDSYPRKATFMGAIQI